jgi:hypothetical protein
LYKFAETSLNEKFDKIFSILSLFGFYNIEAQQVVKKYPFGNGAYHDDGFQNK